MLFAVELKKVMSMLFPWNEFNVMLFRFDVTETAIPRVLLLII